MKLRKFLMALSISVLASNAAAQDGKFALPPLNYAYGDLDAAINAETMETHYKKHHQAYIDKLNGEIDKNAELKGKTIDEIIANVSKYNNVVRNNGGGHWNHSFFWEIMAPASKSGKPSAELQKAIEEAFGSFDVFKTKFEEAGVGQFGSGWVWLIVNTEGKLQVVSTPNQDNPLMDNAPVKGTPVLGNDVWEHAYYLKFQNKRADYLKAWWSVVNWDKVSKNYALATKK